MFSWTLLFWSASFVGVIGGSLPGLHAGNPDAKRLYDDLLSNYNKLVRPVVNTSDILTVRIKLKLSQLIDVNLKNQIMTTNLWVEQYWYDYKLQWEPSEYGGVTMLHVPSDHIWRPDIVLYNNADGNFEVTLATKATLYYNGLVAWKPPAIYKSSCTIDVDADGHYEVKLLTKATVYHNGLVAWQPPAIYKSACDLNLQYFPLDVQTCILKLGTWTYSGAQVDLRHLDEVEGTSVVEIGIDLSGFYMSVEWDILEVPAVRSEKFYTCCDEPYLDITFNITMRRKTLFYTVNLIIPCMGISFLTILTFYLPSDSGEKVTLSISILISLHVFFLLVVEIIPPTSLVVPLLGKYLIFAMILVSISICVTVVVLNVHFRSPQTHKMAPWVKRVFIHILPRLLVMRRPQFQIDKHSADQGWNWSWSKWMVRTCNANGSELRDVSMGSSYHPESQLDGFGFNKGSGFFHRESSMDRDSLADELPRLRTLLGAGDVIFSSACRLHGTQTPGASSTQPLNTEFDTGTLRGSTTLRSRVLLRGDSLQGPLHRHCTADLHKSCLCVRFIAEHTRLKEQSTRVKEDWKYVAMVLDRLFLWIFTLAVLVGTTAIILQAPSLYDDRVPIDKSLSEIAGANLRGRASQ